MEIGKTYKVAVVSVTVKDDDGNIIPNETKQFVVLDSLHGDKENGQPERHYHVDTRFDQIDSRLRIDESRVVSKHYEDRVCVRAYTPATPIDFLVNSKIKRRCLTKDNRCPHKGFKITEDDLFRGELHCPLHGLRFDAQTKVMVDSQQRFFDRKIMMDKIFPEFSEKDRNLGVILGYEFPYISPTIKNYEEKKLELIELRKQREA